MPEYNLIDRKPEQKFFAMFVGRHHSGKTVAEMSFPKPLQVEDFDGRITGGQVPWLDLKGIKYEPWPPRMEGFIQKLNQKLENMLSAAQMQMMGSAAGDIISLPKTHVTDSITNQTFAFIAHALGLTHEKEYEGKKIKAGRWIGPIKMAGPEDYGLEAQATYDYFSTLRSMPIPNVIVSAHLVDMYGFAKDDEGNDLIYAPKIVTGQKLSIRDKIGENIQTMFDHVFKFERETVGQTDKFYVTFRGGIACSAFDWLPYGRQEWTKKPFYEFMMSFKERADRAAQAQGAQKK